MATIKNNVGEDASRSCTDKFNEILREAFRKAAEDSMERMGYLVVAQDGWIIRLFKDGRIEKIEEIEKIDIPFILD